jgi:murein DD-endopeptidase MepM/ murein hydrolase activator NlpD
MVVVGACRAGIVPMQPRGPGASGTVPVAVPPSATDVEYFDASPLMVPVHGIGPSKVRDTFNEPRDGGRLHRATDILAPSGTPVVAAADGTILRMSQNALGGVTIYILDTQARFLYYYAHLERYSDLVSPGVRVQQGDILGYVGKTGNATVPHLHFQAMRWDPNRRDYWNGAPVDVRPYFTLTGTGRAP